MSKYMPTIKKYWYCFILGPTFMIIEAVGEFILPFLNARMIDQGAAFHNINYIIQNGLDMFIIALIMLVAGVVGAYFSIHASCYIARDLRMKTFQKIQTLSFSRIDDFSTGSLITRITNDVTQIQNFSQQLLRGCFRSPVMLIGALCMSFSLNNMLAWTILIVVPMLTFAIVLIIKIASPRYKIMQKSIDHLNNDINETLTNERVIKSFVREKHETQRFEIINHQLRQKSIQALKTMILIQPLSSLAIYMTTIAVVWIAGKQIMIGQMEIGTLTAFITYLSQILTALNFLANIFLTGARAATSDQRISEVLNTIDDLNDKNAIHKDQNIQQGNIIFDNVSFRYFKKNPSYVLEHINLSIHAGETIGIIGSTGSGKTSLISLIPRLYDVDEGAIYIDGINIKDYSLTHLRESIAVVLQKNTLFLGTIKENLRWGKEFASDEELKEVSQIACADQFIESFPKKYDTLLEQGGANLSGGQRQRLCLARALLKKPKILILDDSTSAVDTATDAKIRYALKTRLQSTTKIIIAQRISSIMDADQIVVLDNGQIVGLGQHQQLIRHCIPYQEIYYSQKDKEGSYE